MKELSIFQHPDFGTVRNVVIKGEPWFMGKDICQVLGIANHKDALGRLDEVGSALPTPSAGSRKPPSLTSRVCTV